jgi:flavin-dependent dehydrogenase
VTTSPPAPRSEAAGATGANLPGAGDQRHVNSGMKQAPIRRNALPAQTLEDGCRVGIVGGGPAGSLFAFFLLRFAEQVDLALEVDIYEPRDFALAGPAGCNMCGGIVSEDLVQMLAVEGIDLPASVVQRGIDAYDLSTPVGRVRIATPAGEPRIAAVHRGGGPRDVAEIAWGGLDGHLLALARGLGANVIRQRVKQAGFRDGHPELGCDALAQRYDLVVGANGVNSAAWKLYEALGIRAAQPRTSRAYITELRLGEEAIARTFGSTMQLFLLDLPRLEFGAIIPKGDFVTVCLLGEDIDRELIEAFFGHRLVRGCLPAGCEAREGVCHCGPKINVREVASPFGDRVVLVGDGGVTRLYKDGLGAAYRTAKAAARTAIFSGVSAADFDRHYRPAYRAIARDNRYGLALFAFVRLAKRLPWLLEGVLEVAAQEQRGNGSQRMSGVLWDVFTGSASYREIARRVVDPRLGASVVRASGRAVGRRLTKGRTENAALFRSG